MVPVPRIFEFGRWLEENDWPSRARLVEPGLARFLRRTGGHDDDLAAGQVFIVSIADDEPADVRLTVHEIESLAVRAFPVQVDQDDLATVLLDEQGEGRGHSHVSGADDADLVSAHLNTLRQTDRNSAAVSV